MMWSLVYSSGSPTTSMIPTTSIILTSSMIPMTSPTPTAPNSKKSHGKSLLL